MTHLHGRGFVATNASIDRIDNTLGYEPSNVRLVCCVVNLMRGRLTDDELRVWCRRILARDEPSGRAP